MRCPHCSRPLGSLNKAETDYRVRLSIVLLEPETGRVHGPCPGCKGDVTVAEGSELIKALTDPPSPVRPGLRVGRRLTPTPGTQ